MRTRVSLTAAACIAAMSLAACSSSGGDSTSPGSTASSLPTGALTSAPLPESASPSGDVTTDQSGSAPAGGSGNAAPVTVNKAIDDTVMGNKATIIKYVRGYQPSAGAKDKYSTLAGEEVVLVDVTVTGSSKYYDSVGADSFYLTGMPDGIDQASTTILDDDIKAAGYPPLEDAQTGKTTTGWVVFTPDKEDAGKLVLRFKRIAAKTSAGQVIPAKNFDVPLG